MVPGFRRAFLALALILPVSECSADGGTESPSGDSGRLYDSQCHDREAWSRIDDFLKQHPRDVLVIRTYALRIGICRLMEENKITPEQGVEIFDIEKQRAIMERQQEEAGRRKRPAIPADKVPPLG